MIKNLHQQSQRVFLLAESEGWPRYLIMISIQLITTSIMMKAEG